MPAWKLVRRTRSATSRSWSSATVARTSAGERGFRSTLKGTSGNARTASARSGARNPRERKGRSCVPPGPTKTWPTSQLRISRNAHAAIGRGRPTILVATSSWKMTTWPSALRCTSVSTASAPTSSARSNASSVFSGSSTRAPRCAKIVVFPSSRRKWGAAWRDREGPREALTASPPAGWGRWGGGGEWSRWARSVAQRPSRWRHRGRRRRRRPRGHAARSGSPRAAFAPRRPRTA